MADDFTNYQMVMIDGFPVDATITETHTFESDVTDFPVESGGSITDNVRPKPITISMECIVSDTPMGRVGQHATRGVVTGPYDTFATYRQGVTPPATAQFVGLNNGRLPSREIFLRLARIREAREPITITTSLTQYKNMVMTSLTVPRTADVGNALKFTVAFQQVIFITNNRTFVRVSLPGTGKSALGAKLAKLGVNPATVFTKKKEFIVPPAYGELFKEPILVEPNGDRHYLYYPNGPTPDGIVDNAGYHPYKKVGFDTKAQLWTNPKTGTPLRYDGGVGFLGQGGGRETLDGLNKQLAKPISSAPETPPTTVTNYYGLVGK